MPYQTIHEAQTLLRGLWRPQKERCADPADSRLADDGRKRMEQSHPGAG